VSDATDSQLLAQEIWSIDLLARETHTEVAKVQQIFLIEYKKLASHAHVTAFLSLLTCNCVRGILTRKTVMTMAMGSLERNPP
jgi:hypothetical protein